MKISPKVLALGVSGLLAIGITGVVLAEGPGGGDGQRQPGDHQGGRHDIVRATLGGIMKASGLSKDVFREGMKAGKSIDQVLTENGVSSATVQAQVLSELKTKLDTAVAGGKLTQEKADALYAKAQEKLPEVMSKTPDPDRQDGMHRPGGAGSGQGRQGEGGEHGRPGHQAGHGVLESAAQTIGVDVEALRTELKGGKTIAEVASAHGVSAQTVIDNAVAAASARIDQAVADGRLTAEQATTMKGKLTQGITRTVNEGAPKKGDHAPQP